MCRKMFYFCDRREAGQPFQGGAGMRERSVRSEVKVFGGGTFLVRSRVLVMAALLAGCSTAGFGDKGGILPVPEGLARIGFAAPVFTGAADLKITRVKYEDGYQREEYALFQGGGAQAEVIYSAVQSPNSVLEAPYTVQQFTETFNAHKGTASFTSGSRETEGSRPLFVRPFTSAATAQRCFGFLIELDREPFDGQQRFTRVAFGYYCAPKGASLNADEIDRLSEKVTLRSPALGAPVNLPSDDGVYHREKLLAAVRTGTLSKVSARQAGNPEFPFRFQRFFVQKSAS